MRGERGGALEEARGSRGIRGVLFQVHLAPPLSSHWHSSFLWLLKEQYVIKEML